MHAQPGDRKCSQPAIGGNHYGPVLVYMAKVSDAKTATSGSFFKVAEDGYTGTTASWGTEILNANCGKRAFTVPKSIASGDYLVRAEAIALHAGAGQPQPYVTCFQVKVTGGGSANPAGVSFPGGYKLRYVKIALEGRKAIANETQRPSLPEGHLRQQLQVRLARPGRLQRLEGSRKAGLISQRLFVLVSICITSIRSLSLHWRTMKAISILRYEN